MEDIGLFKQGCKWLLSQKQMFLGIQSAFWCFKDFLVERHWPMLYRGCVNLGKSLFLLLLLWRDCIVRGFRSSLGLGPTVLFVVMWSCFLSLTSITCLAYVLLMLGAAGAVILCLGYNPGLFIAGLFGILLMWMYGTFWITGMLLIVGGYFYSLNHARPVILMSTVYAVYCVRIDVGWLGVFLSINLAFFSNDLFSYLLQVYDSTKEEPYFEEQKESGPIPEDYSGDSEYSSHASESENLFSSKSSSKETSTTKNLNSQNDSSPSRVVKADSSSIDEMKRILNSLDHYEALGILRNKSIDIPLLRKEYRRKAMLVHPDKNMGCPLSSESFKKLQCAYEVLSDSTKKRDYDEQLRKEESRSVRQRSRSTSRQEGVVYRSEESRRIQCTKCGNSHIWICTNRTKANARWCQDCCQYHPAKDGDGWVEKTFEKVEIPRAFVCAESKIFDVSEWAMCQGMTCRPNTHRPSFHVNMVGLERSSHRSNDGMYPWDLDAEMEEDKEDDFEMWFQQALASGFFSETSSRSRWSSFKLHHKKGKKLGRRSL
eukprot:TRINITY_DN3688_c0_g2_i2.p1 TRINITY_DN3688_c0_g2~~TRINITY_DN3688_c0_g2_i2.p1  ORF type:complete len:542 (+),score=69.90 TRINITY_DN3688_c0_g2_i2:1003-2628(+)